MSTYMYRDLDAFLFDLRESADACRAEAEHPHGGTLRRALETAVDALEELIIEMEKQQEAPK